MTIAPAHRTLLMLAGLVAVGGGLFGTVTGNHHEGAVINAAAAGVLLVAAVLTRIGGRAWTIAAFGALSGMLTAILVGLHNFRVALSWSHVDDPVTRTAAAGVAVAIGVMSLIGAITVWQALPRWHTDASRPTGAAHFRAHGRRLATGVGMTCMALGFCAIKATRLPQLAVASLSDPATSPLVSNHAVQQVITDPRVLYRLRHEPGFRRSALRMGVPPELVRFALEIAEQQYGELSDAPHHPPRLRVDPATRAALPPAELQIAAARTGRAPPRASAPGDRAEPSPISPARVAPDRIAVPRVDTDVDAPRVLVPDLARAPSGPSPEPAGSPADDLIAGLMAASPTDDPSTATTAATLVTNLLREAPEAETLLDTAVHRTELGGTLLMGLGGLLVLVAIVARRPAPKPAAT